MRKDIKKGGFNLIELLVVMAIIAVLVALVIAAINIARRASRDTTRRSNAQSIKSALEDYYARMKSYPPAGGAAATTYADLGQIKTVLNNGVACGASTAGICALTDPSGADNAAGAGNRYCLRRGANGDGVSSKYTLRIRMESAPAGTPTCTGAINANDENFSQD